MGVEGKRNEGYRVSQMEAGAVENANLTKPCPYCGEDVKTSARKCRHCQAWLSLMFRPFPGNLFAFALGVIIALGGIAYTGYYFASKLDLEGEKTYPGSAIRILSHSLQEVNGRWVILGKLKNFGKETWGRIKVEAEFYDAKGNLVDERFAYIDQRMASGEEEGFMIRQHRPSRPFKTYTLKVARARRY